MHMLDTSLDSTNFYFLVAVLQGLVLSGFILFQKPRQKPGGYLGILILLFSISLLHLTLEQSIHVFNKKFPVPMDFSLAYGPLAYLHVLSIVKPKAHRFRNHWKHFLPTIILDGFLFSAMFIYLGQHEDWAYANIPLIQGVGLSMALLSTLHLGFYGWRIHRLSKQKDLLMKESGAVAKWVRVLLIWCFGFSGTLFIALTLGLLNLQILDDNSEPLYGTVGTIVGAGIYLLGYAYLTRYSKPIYAYTKKALNFKFGVDELETKRQGLLNALEEQKLYTDPSLSLAGLANHLNYPINDLSSLINEGMKTNFTDLINQHRVQAFIKLSESPDSQKYSLLGLAEEAGFSSKASFYRIFKKETGMTPNSYLKAKNEENGAI